MSERFSIDRREFIKVVGGGVVVLVGMGPSALLAQDRRRVYPEDLNAYLRIGEDGRVTVFTGKIEMGQGVMTSQAQMVAEELRVALGAVEMVMGDTDRCPWDMGTFGSLTTRMFGPFLRAAAAEARAVMLRLASEKLGVPRGKLVVADGVVSVAGEPARRVTYGELAQGRRILRTVDDTAVLRKVSEFTVMGGSPQRFDAVAKVTGAAQFAGDVVRPGMLFACVLRPPAHGAKLTRLDVNAAAKLPGVTVVNEGGLVAALHADPEAAAKALARIDASWETPAPPFDTETVFDHLVKAAKPGEAAGVKGDVAAARAAATRLFESTFHKGYVAHAPIEPHTAVAESKDGKVTVWASTQTPFPTRERIARELGLANENVRVITPFVGGGFGGKSAGLQASEAARLAKITGKPVQVRWSRAEEFFYDTFDPAAVVKLVTALDAAGRITLWDYHVVAAGDRGAELFYDVPNASIRVSGGWRGEGTELHLFGVGPWRAPGANMNVFAKESQVDIMAAAAGIDPIELRLRNMTDGRMRRVLEAAAAAYGWKPRAVPARTGRGRGVACGVDAGSYVALIADVAVDRGTGTVEVERVVAAQEMGVVVNPEGAKMQMEGCITQGLGYALTEELRFRGGEILDRNFDTYALPRFSWLPRIETVLVRNDGLDPQGGGEPAIVPMGGAIANAVFDATGVRFYRLPLTAARVRAALAKPA
ncbi:MAG: xanthine dehydrogenase family protein molybdopterin-binding subunit [Acidobacteria bacterium]|nr:xanthine dehydrogenase family protein molybdopterin-binding subunit [Acidobacteriota bacterium]